MVVVDVAVQVTEKVVVGLAPAPGLFHVQIRAAVVVVVERCRAPERAQQLQAVAERWEAVVAAVSAAAALHAVRVGGYAFAVVETID